MKVTFFIGREHHAQKLLPVAMYGKKNELIEPQYLVADNAINIDPPTEFVRKYPPIVNGDIVHLKEYERPGKVNDKPARSLIRKVFKQAGAHSVSPFWLAYSAREAVRVNGAVKDYLKQQEPEAVFLLHGQNFWAKVLAYQASISGIPVYSLQEGIVLEREERDMKKYTGQTDYVSKIFSWSEYDKRFYAEPDKIVPTGPPHLDYWVPYRDSSRKRLILRHELLRDIGLTPLKPTILYAPPRLDLYRGNPIKALQHLLSWALRSGVNIACRLHPFQGEVQEINRLLSIYPSFRIYKGPDSVAAVLSSDMVITQTSTIAVEAVAMGVPVIEYDLDYMGVEQSLSELGAAQILLGRDMKPIEDVLIGNIPIDSINRFIIKRLSLVDGNSSQRIVEEIVGD